jgi:hypothetical protein
VEANHGSFLPAKVRKTTLEDHLGKKIRAHHQSHQFIPALTSRRPRLIIGLPLSGSAHSQHEPQARGGVSPRLADLDTVQHQQHAHHWDR